MSFMPIPFTHLTNWGHLAKIISSPEQLACSCLFHLKPLLGVHHTATGSLGLAMHQHST